jgi:hypothetical protein
VRVTAAAGWTLVSGKAPSSERRQFTNSRTHITKQKRLFIEQVNSAVRLLDERSLVHEHSIRKIVRSAYQAGLTLHGPCNCTDTGIGGLYLKVC